MFKDICKSFFLLLVTTSAFYLGLYLGREKVLSRIPDFQEDQEEED